MTRIVLGIEYDGTNFYGWQTQQGLRTIQTELEAALSQVANEEVKVICAGRTDRGVHAYGQIVHFDTKVERPLHAWQLGANAILQNDIVVTSVKQVDDSFHARFSAVSRSYRYVIANTKIAPAIMRFYQTWHSKSLDEKKMAIAAQYLIGEHDFSSFRAADCQSKTPMRNVSQIKIERQGDLIVIDITANAFLHHMVRNIVGVLLAVGEGKRPEIWVQQVLQACDRKMGYVTAKPNGLCFMHVEYGCNSSWSVNQQNTKVSS